MARTKLAISNETKSKDLTGKVYIVTGANSGVGLETTRQLIKQGAHVIMGCRRVEAGQEVAKEFDSLNGSYEVSYIDLTDLSTVRNFAANFLAKNNRLDGLDCNAGMVAMGSERRLTKDDFELTIGISYFGHFLLTELLLDILKKTEGSRIVILSSCVHAGNNKNRPAVDMSDINYETRKYDAMAAYQEAKVANVLYGVELADRLKDTSVSVASVHPGWARSSFGQERAIMRVVNKIMSPFIRSMTDSNEESAQTSLHCLISSEATNHSGAYFSQSSVLYNDNECKAGGWPMKSPNPNATNLDTAKKLVAMTYDLVGLK